MGVPRTTVQYWEKTESKLRSQTQEKLRSTNYFIHNENDYRITGQFPKQQKKTFDDIKERRFHGKPVSTKWIRRRMKYHCETDKPQGYTSTKNKFKEHWVKKYMKRHQLSIRRKTNIKKKSIWERLHKIENYHHFCIYRVADAEISSETPSDSELDSDDAIIQWIGK